METTLWDIIPLLLAHDVIISVYVHIWDIMAGTSTMQGEGSGGKLCVTEFFT